jgi:hypothetical protein
LVNDKTLPFLPFQKLECTFSQKFANFQRLQYLTKRKKDNLQAFAHPQRTESLGEKANNVRASWELNLNPVDQAIQAARTTAV